MVSPHSARLGRARRGCARDAPHRPRPPPPPPARLPGVQHGGQHEQRQRHRRRLQRGARRAARAARRGAAPRRAPPRRRRRRRPRAPASVAGQPPRLHPGVAARCLGLSDRCRECESARSARCMGMVTGGRCLCRFRKQLTQRRDGARRKAAGCEVAWSSTSSPPPRSPRPPLPPAPPRALLRDIPHILPPPSLFTRLPADQAFANLSRRATPHAQPRREARVGPLQQRPAGGAGPAGAPADGQAPRRHRSARA
jgi:hypothetical protein